MPHVREQIRDAAIAKVRGLKLTGDRVFSSRTLAVPAAQLPALVVYTAEEEEEQLTMGADPTVHHFLDLVVIGLAQVVKDLDDALDDIAGEVAAAIGGDHTLGGLAKTVELAASEMTLTGEGEQEQGVVKLTFAAEYQTKRSDPTTAV